MSRSILFRPCLTSGVFLLVAGCSSAFYGNPFAGMQLCGCAAVFGLVAWWSSLANRRHRQTTDRYPVVTVDS